MSKSNSFLELGLFDNSFENRKPNLSFNSKNFSDISELNKTNFAAHYHYLCKGCKEVPIIESIKKNKIKFICNCPNSPIELPINQIYDDYLYYSEYSDETNIISLKCKNNSEEKYDLYCEKCKKNRCPKCADECIDHKNSLKYLPLDQKVLNKKNYILEKIKDKNQTYIDSEYKSSLSFIQSENNDEHNISENRYIKENDSFNNEVNSSQNEIINIRDNFFNKLSSNDKIEDEIKDDNKIIVNVNNNENSSEQTLDDEYYYINLIIIILDDYYNYPNFNHFETISYIEKFVVLTYEEHEEINLRYELYEKDIKDNSFEIFGEIFVNNNNEKCFLSINERLIDLKRFINLSDIYDKEVIINDWPYIIDVKLIERNNNKMNDLSFMFHNINTLSHSSNFFGFKYMYIKKLNNMFYNCSSIKKLPNISVINTSNVIDMSNMFYNCSSITELEEDISKWDMKEVITTSQMFHNCKLLSSLPDISKWELNNIKYMNCMFKNCESLSALPNLSGWIKKGYDVEISEIFEGCILLEKDIQKKLFDVNPILRCIKNIYNIIFYYFNKIFGGVSCCFNIIFILSFIAIIFYGACPLASIYYSFNLNKASQSIKNPIEYFNITNNSSIFKFIYKNQTDFINYSLN